MARRVGSFSTTASTVVLMWERFPVEFEAWQKHPSGDRATKHVASSVSANVLPRHRFSHSGFKVRNGAFQRPTRNRLAEMQASIAGKGPSRVVSKGK